MEVGEVVPYRCRKKISAGVSGCLKCGDECPDMPWEVRVGVRASPYHWLDVAWELVPLTWLPGPSFPAQFRLCGDFFVAGHLSTLTGDALLCVA